MFSHVVELCSTAYLDKREVALPIYAFLLMLCCLTSEEVVVLQESPFNLCLALESG